MVKGETKKKKEQEKVKKGLLPEMPGSEPDIKKQSEVFFNPETGETLLQRRTKSGKVVLLPADETRRLQEKQALTPKEQQLLALRREDVRKQAAKEVEQRKFQTQETAERVETAEEAGAFQPLPVEPKEIIPGESERGSFERFSEGISKSGFGKAYRFIDTLGGVLPDYAPEEQEVVIREEAKKELAEDIEETTKELDNNLTKMGFGGIVGAAFVGGAAAEADIGAVFFASKEKVQNFESTIETLNQMSTTISSAVSDGTLNGADGLKAMNNIQRLLDLRRQQVKEIAIGSPTVRITDTLVKIQTDLFEARTENQLELDKVATIYIEGQAEPTNAQLLVTKLRIQKLRQKNG